MATKKDLLDARDRITKAATAARAARDKLRLDLAELADEHAVLRTTDFGRREQRDQLLATARQVRPEAEQALALAKSMAHRRAAVTGTATVLREACFLEPIRYSGDDFVTDHDRLHLAETRLLREELMRMRVRGDLMEAPAEELADMISAAALANNLALLEMARRVVRVRAATESLDQLRPAKVALTDALAAIPLPPDVQRLDALFAEIDTTAAGLAEALEEIETGRPPQVPRSAIDLVDAIGGQAAAEQRIAEQHALKARAATGAAKVVERAIRADETAALQIPITHNPEPSAA